MGKVKRLELWWQLYRTSPLVWDLENFWPMDFCWTECTCGQESQSAKCSSKQLQSWNQHCDINTTRLILYEGTKLCLSANAAQTLTNTCLQHPYQSICTLPTLPYSSLLQVSSRKSWWTWAILIYFYSPSGMTFNLQPWYSSSLTSYDKWPSTLGNFELLKSNDYTNPHSEVQSHNTGFEPTISAGERPKTYALDRETTGTGG
jgi:hypothetical protein